MELSVLDEGTLGGLEFVSWTALGVGFLPSFGERGRVGGVCRKLQNNNNGRHISKMTPEWSRKNYR